MTENIRSRIRQNLIQHVSELSNASKRHVYDNIVELKKKLGYGIKSIWPETPWKTAEIKLQHRLTNDKQLIEIVFNKISGIWMKVLVLFKIINFILRMTLRFLFKKFRKIYLFLYTHKNLIMIIVPLILYILLLCKWYTQKVTLNNLVNKYLAEGESISEYHKGMNKLRTYAREMKKMLPESMRQNPLSSKAFKRALKNLDDFKYALRWQLSYRDSDVNTTIFDSTYPYRAIADKFFQRVDDFREEIEKRIGSYGILTKNHPSMKPLHEWELFLTDITLIRFMERMLRKFAEIRHISDVAMTNKRSLDEMANFFGSNIVLRIIFGPILQVVLFHYKIYLDMGAAKFAIGVLKNLDIRAKDLSGNKFLTQVGEYIYNALVKKDEEAMLFTISSDFFPVPEEEES